MTGKEDFLTAFNGHGNAYSTICLIDVALDELIDVLNKIRPDGCFGSGHVDKRCIYFEACKELPDDLLAELTTELQCKGFGDIGDWYGYPYFVAYKNGEVYDNYTAAWDKDCPSPYDSEVEGDDADCWDAFFTVRDNESGVTFHTGDGAIDTETLEAFKEVVQNHPERSGR